MSKSGGFAGEHAEELVLLFFFFRGRELGLGPVNCVFLFATLRLRLRRALLFLLSRESDSCSGYLQLPLVLTILRILLALPSERHSSIATSEKKKEEKKNHS